MLVSEGQGEGVIEVVPPVAVEPPPPAPPIDSRIGPVGIALFAVGLAMPTYLVLSMIGSHASRCARWHRLDERLRRAPKRFGETGGTMRPHYVFSFIAFAATVAVFAWHHRPPSPEMSTREEDGFQVRITRHAEPNRFENLPVPSQKDPDPTRFTLPGRYEAAPDLALDRELTLPSAQTDQPRTVVHPLVNLARRLPKMYETSTTALQTMR